MLKEVIPYQDEENTWWLKLVYEYDNSKGLHKCIFPKVFLPIEQFEAPSELTEINNSNEPWFTQSAPRSYLPLQGRFNLHAASIEDPRTGEKLDAAISYDILVKPKIRKMTLKEIEDKLGCKIELVNEEDLW